MCGTLIDKAELEAYQFKYVAQTWYVQCRDNRSLRGCTMTLEMFNRDFLDWFFPRDLREATVGEFINLHQGGMSVLDYSLKFTKLSKYAPSLVSNPRDEMSHFLTEVSKDLVEECCSTMNHDNMNISHVMVHAKQVEESRLRINSKEVKMAKSYEVGS